jgi:hypothetical protein
MKLIYNTPNLVHFLGHISNVLNHNYGSTTKYERDSSNDSHASIMVRVGKRRDAYLHMDMTHAIMLTATRSPNSNISIRETMYSYYITMTLPIISGCVNMKIMCLWINSPNSSKRMRGMRDNQLILYLIIPNLNLTFWMICDTFLKSI